MKENQTSSILKCTNNLRWLQKKHEYKIFFIKRSYKTTILQQTHIDNHGNEIWKNIDVVNLVD